MMTMKNPIVNHRLLISFLTVILIISGELGAQVYRDNQVEPERLMDLLDISPGMFIGEAGAGSGYLTLYLAKRVRNAGHIYANDIDPDSLEKLKSKAEKENMANITCVTGESDDPLFPKRDLDMIIMLHSFHEFENHVEWLKNAKKYIRTDGRIVILDAWFDDGRIMTKEFIEATAAEAGYVLDMYDPYLRNVHVFVLRIED